MKRLQLLRWSGSVLSPRIQPTIRRSAAPQQLFFTAIRQQSAAFSSAVASQETEFQDEDDSSAPPTTSRPNLPPSPDVEASLTCPKLAAIHARLALPKRLPLQTLARTLVDESADPSPQFNNKSLSILGGDLLTYYTSEHLLCTFPRLPIKVLWAAMYSFVGPKTLGAMAREWGVEFAAEPGYEVDPGLLQFKRLPPDTSLETNTSGEFLGPAGKVLKRGTSGRIVTDNAFGESAPITSPAVDGVTPNQASANFVRAVLAAIYLHAGRPAAKEFYKEHFLSRHLDMASLFTFSQPTRDLSKLCRREGFEAPVAKILSETGRLSNRPVFNVGIFSGSEKIGEGAGGSLIEARFRAAAAALKGWYLYSPLGVQVPSSTEEDGAAKWTPVYIDPGEIIV
ncbi:hypothetical protein FQN55_004621 [Onygenales sp. PD_40]|nr:hypothetical protein FQN55_004621 [Onygenales sp. PD_40]KAK2788618.1 hypothetical protein FQN52_006561 [Onygenales sp. PD_12]KAK2795066.1 hypothetical protein FQN51_000582 [Onygenales sp. PD_10]